MWGPNTYRICDDFAPIGARPSGVSRIGLAAQVYQSRGNPHDIGRVRPVAETKYGYRSARSYSESEDGVGGFGPLQTLTPEEWRD